MSATILETSRPANATVKEAAAFLNISAITVYRLIEAGHLRPVRIGRCVRLPWAQLERFAAEGTPNTD